MLASTKTRAPSGRSSSFIHIFFKDSINYSWIGGNDAKRRLGDTRLPAPFTFPVFGWRYEDFHLGPIGHRERFFQDDHIPLRVSFISHSRVSSVDDGLGLGCYLPIHACAELAGAWVLTIGLRHDDVLSSRSLLFQPVFLMQATNDRMGDDSQMLRKPVPVHLQWHREGGGRLRDPRTQGHMGTTCVVLGRSEERRVGKEC